MHSRKRDETPVVLTNGQTVRLHPIQPDDAPALQRFQTRLSRRSLHYRFFGAVPQLSDRQARQLAEVDYVNRFAVVALAPEDADEIIGVARFEREAGADEAEVAIIVADAYQGQGLGRAMLALLLEAARRRNIKRLYGLVLADNARMIQLLRNLGYPYRQTWEGGSLQRVEVDVPPAGSGGGTH